MRRTPYTLPSLVVVLAFVLGRPQLVVVLLFLIEQLLVHRVAVAPVAVVAAEVAEHRDA